ncbi:hypothetical protein M427DRAFT_146244 [Gonapodya prolifera JEL478]|uniref:Uncharacterized protein n=1 Tax=Gonapodya prolifera (strain JEL478) TaxID=1344416 RepID=A0A139ABJ1_GONPJ|nr:hypothetical protein M427DRAFT_146244 [Gonapodya prolifera JEL478]|eukprot:KXS14039.1 hypothetical protein M427DRAFT_146244 [Gonapodya prolifera JEL478]
MMSMGSESRLNLLASSLQLDGNGMTTLTPTTDEATSSDTTRSHSDPLVNAKFYLSLIKSIRIIMPPDLLVYNSRWAAVARSEARAAATVIKRIVELIGDTRRNLNGDEVASPTVGPTSPHLASITFEAALLPPPSSTSFGFSLTSRLTSRTTTTPTIASSPHPLSSSSPASSSRSRAAYNPTPDPPRLHLLSLVDPKPFAMDVFTAAKAASVRTLVWRGVDLVDINPGMVGEVLEAYLLLGRAATSDVLLSNSSGGGGGVAVEVTPPLSTNTTPTTQTLRRIIFEDCRFSNRPIRSSHRHHYRPSDPLVSPPTGPTASSSTLSSGAALPVPSFLDLLGLTPSPSTTGTPVSASSTPLAAFLIAGWATVGMYVSVSAMEGKPTTEATVWPGGNGRSGGVGLELEVRRTVTVSQGSEQVMGTGSVWSKWVRVAAPRFSAPTSTSPRSPQDRNTSDPSQPVVSWGYTSLSGPPSFSPPDAARWSWDRWEGGGGGSAMDGDGDVGCVVAGWGSGAGGGEG